jgi:SAM-dependent methyltransferase
MKSSKFPIWKNNGRPAVECKHENRRYVKELLDAIERKELLLVENHCLCNNEHKENDIIVSKKDRYGLPIPQIICSKCGLIRSGVVFNEQSNNLFYEKYYRKVYTAHVPNNLFFQDQVMMGNFILELLEQHSLVGDIKDVVEIGCGAGGILLPFQKKEKNISGYDFDNNYLNYGRQKGLNLYYGDFYKQAADSSCDLIIMNHVFEHLLSPLQEMQKLLPKLRTSKYLYIQVPGVFCISEIYPDPLTYFQNAHVYNFYEQYLRILFERYGLKVIYGDERCTFICQKTSDITPQINYIYDDSLSVYPQKNANYILECKKRYDKKTFQKRIYNTACALGWKHIRPYIKRDKTYSK